MLFNGRVVRVCAKVKRWRDGKGEAEKQKPESTFFEASTKLQLHSETKIAEAELRRFWPAESGIIGLPQN